MSHPTPLLEDILLMLCAMVLTQMLFQRLRLSPVIAYLALGVLLGDSLLGLVTEPHTIEVIAEFGLVLLLFTLGIEFSLSRLIAMRRLVLGLGTAQVLVTSMAGAVVALLWGEPLAGAVVVGGVLALSSTAIVIKQLGEQLEIAAPHGRAAVGVLLFQDLAAIPLLIAIPVLGGGSGNLGMELFSAMVTGLAISLLLIAAGRWLLEPLFHSVSRFHSAELFTLTVLMVAAISAWVSAKAGLSMALGAFLAGIMLSETAYRHQIEQEIRPFRDVLLGLFFVSIGLLLDARVLFSQLHWVLLGVAGLVAVKTLIVLALGRVFGLPRLDSMRSGLVLAQAGEFGFAVIALALTFNVLTTNAAQLVLAVAVVSMLLSPFLIRYNLRLAQWLLPARSLAALPEEPLPGPSLDEAQDSHLILCGFGRVGQNLAGLLEQDNLPFVALELDPGIMREAQQAGLPVFYGDSERADILNAAGLARARALVICHQNEASAVKTVHEARRINPHLPILVRTPTDRYLDDLVAAGATEVIPDPFEASLMLAEHLMRLLGVPFEEREQRFDAIRNLHYAPLRHTFRGEQELKPLDHGLRLKNVVLTDAAYAIGHSLGALELKRLEVRVAAIRRRGVRGEPEEATVLEPGDVLILLGTPASLSRSERLLLDGHAD